MIKAVRGTRDLLPPETAVWNFVEAKVREVFCAYNFQEIRTPIFESTELFARGVGEETDIVSKEMYTWHDGERFDEEALRKEWISRGEAENRLYVERATPVNAYLEPLGILLINHRPWRPDSPGPDQPEFVCFRAKAGPEAAELLRKAREHTKSSEFVRQYGEDAQYAQRARLRIVVPAGTADSATGAETQEIEVEPFQTRTQVFKSSQSLTLRPEATAGIVRAYIEHNLGERGVNKLYCIGPMFRRERPQKGRYRQFYQIDAEVIGPPSSGSESPARDAEILELIATLLDRLGIKGWNLELNSVGCPDDRARFNQALRKALEPVVGQMCPDCQRRAVTNPLRVFDCKVAADQPIIEKLPRISQFLDDPCRQHFDAVQQILTNLGVPFTLNDRLVRGLDYYTRTAFEFTHGGLGAQNAILGGGRYDGLSESLGGPAAPGIGFAIGEDRLVMSLEESLGDVVKKPDVYVAALGAGMNGEAARLARELRRENLVVDLGDETFRLKKSFEAATKAGAKYILIVGENEVQADAFALKDLATGEQVSLPRGQLVSRIKSTSLERAGEGSINEPRRRRKFLHED
jgi:histidyl-tRNA synthetase